MFCAIPRRAKQAQKVCKRHLAWRAGNPEHVRVNLSHFAFLTLIERGCKFQHQFPPFSSSPDSGVKQLSPYGNLQFGLVLIMCVCCLSKASDSPRPTHNCIILQFARDLIFFLSICVSSLRQVVQ